ncbi:cytochrome P450, family 96, subfamily A, polypeptide 10 [Actinidia rufa]|uniref:Cytochrome P450, family 96, subfamily A, polypeptide 10 n=1 Tax=Actinidia rufa TaxID=165716 RepID=A0A7J0EL69_9ERIC|nr:cytochrome P450, family 96, subfamily A, polypeptide 10 [Actinidia rufa]
MSSLGYHEIILALVCFLFLYLLGTVDGVPRNWPFIGMLPSLLLNIHQIHNWCTDILGRVGGTFLFKGPWFANMDMLVTADPANVHYIMSDNFSNFPKGPQFLKIFDVLGSLSADASPSPRDVSPSPRDVSPSTVTSAHCFLKGRKLWRYVTGDIKAPTQGAAETSTEFIVRLEEWDSKNHQIITYTTADLACQYQLMTSLCRQRQEPGQSISAFLPQIYSIWDQLTPSEPKWLCAGDSTLFATYRDQQCLILFLMGLSDIYEPVRASLLHRIPLPTLEQAISELLSEETRLGLVSTSHVATALATPGSRGRGSSGGSRSFFSLWSSILWWSDCPNNSTRRDTRPQSTAATAGVSSTASASSTLIDISDLPALVQQIMIRGRMSSSTPPYLTDPSIDLFPDDVDVPADPPDDTLHVAPPSIVYPVESSSTDLAPPVLPPAPLPSDIPARRSTRTKYASDLLTRAGLSDYGIFNSDADLWRIQRKHAQLQISHQRFHRFLVKTSQDKVEKWLVPILEHVSKLGIPVDLQDLFQRFTFDTTSILVTGYDPGCLSVDLPNVPFSKAMDDAEEALLFRHVLPESVWKLQRWLKVGHEKKLSRAWATLDHIIGKYISMRRNRLSKGIKPQEEEEGVNLLTSYLNEDEIMGLKCDNKFLRDTIMNFMIAGRDTTSSALTWFLWLVSTHPDVEAKIREELKGIVPERESNQWRLYRVEEVSKLVYLHSALCESLRLYPPVPFQHKEPLQPDILPSGNHVNPKMKILFSLYAMGRMKFIWGEDCSDFKPERWISKRGTIKHMPSSKFLAFNAGPRTCLGKKVAFTQMKVVAAAIIHNYYVEVMECHPVVPNVSIILYMKHGLMAKINKRW